MGSGYTLLQNQLLLPPSPWVSFLALSGTASINFIDSLLWDFKTHQKTIKYITNTTMFRNLFEDNDFSDRFPLHARVLLQLPPSSFPVPFCIHMHSYFSILCIARLLWGFAVVDCDCDWQ